MSRPRLISIKFLIFVIIIGAIMPLVLAGWRDLWNIFLENSKPKITLHEFPRGIGVVPSELNFTVKDQGAGIGEIVVRLRQRNNKKEIFRKSYARSKKEKIELTLTNDDNFFKEGAAEIQINSSDKSFWSNSSLETIPLTVDFKKPYVKILSTQHNIRRGGSQLVLYQAEDNHLGFHGVRVDRQSYLGFPISGLIPEINAPDVYAAFFSVSLTDSKDPSVKVFAEDVVGNGTSTSFYHKILDAPIRAERISLSEKFLTHSAPEIYKENLENMQKWANEIGEKPPQELDSVNDQLGIEVFKFLNRTLRKWSDLELRRNMTQQRLDRIWDGYFEPAAGTVRSAFGRKIFYDYKGENIDTALQDGYEILTGNEVRATNHGIVSSVANYGTYGKSIIVDHGLGIFSVYSWLGETFVSLGEEVEAGQKLAETGATGLSREGSYLVQIRLAGQPVNPREWWDKSWYYAHVTDKLNQLKRQLGHQTLRNNL